MDSETVRILVVVIGGGLLSSVLFGPLGDRWEYKGPPQEERIAADRAHREQRRRDKAAKKRATERR